MTKGTKFTDIMDFVDPDAKCDGIELKDIPEEQWRGYTGETSVRSITIKKNAKGAGGSIRDTDSGEEIQIKKLGKIPTAFKKLVVSIEPDMEITPKGRTHDVEISWCDGAVVYLSSSKITSANFEIGEAKNINFVLNKAVSDSHFSQEKYDKVVDTVISRVKENKSKVVFKLGEKASTKFLAVDHKTHGVLAAFFIRDPVKKKDLLISFGSTKVDSNVENHKHVVIPDMTKKDAGFLAYVFKNMLFIAGKSVKTGAAKSTPKAPLKGAEKGHAFYPHLESLVKEMEKNSGFVRIAVESGRRR